MLVAKPDCGLAPDGAVYCHIVIVVQSPTNAGGLAV